MESLQISRPVSVATHEPASQDVPIQDQDLVDFDVLSSQTKVIFKDFDKKVSTLSAFNNQIVSHGFRMEPDTLVVSWNLFLIESLYHHCERCAAFMFSSGLF